MINIIELEASVLDTLIKGGADALKLVQILLNKQEEESNVSKNKNTIEREIKQVVRQLCTTYDVKQEDKEQYNKNISDIIGGTV